MKIVINTLNKSPIEKFAKEHDLVMEVFERGEMFKHRGRYYALFSGCSVNDSGVLLEEYGEGDTPERAISDYAKRISGKDLFAGGDLIVVPMLQKKNPAEAG